MLPFDCVSVDPLHEIHNNKRMADFCDLIIHSSFIVLYLWQATEYLKMSNFTWFSKEMEGLIRDLEYTKDRYIQSQRNNLVSEGGSYYLSTLVSLM